VDSAVGSETIMASTLVFPDGVRLAERQDIPGPEASRAVAWARVRSASIAQGFVYYPSDDKRYRGYAEINVDAPRIWTVFCDLCRTLLGETASLAVSGGHEEEPYSLGTASVHRLIAMLESHQYQLTHDGFLEFGLMDQDALTTKGVFVTETKYFKVWLNDEAAFRSVMRQHSISEPEKLEFIDEYPFVAVRLPSDKAPLKADELFQLFEHKIEGVKSQ